MYRGWSHYLANLYGVECLDAELLCRQVKAAVKCMGDEVLHQNLTSRNEGDHSLITATRTGHFVVHTTRETRYMGIDVVTADALMDPSKGASFLVKDYRPRTWEVENRQRGLAPLATLERRRKTS